MDNRTGNLNRKKSNSLRHASSRPNADFQKVTHGIHSFSQAALGSFLRPQEGLGIGLWEDTRGTDEVPRCEGKASVAVVLLGCYVLYKSGIGLEI